MACPLVLGAARVNRLTARVGFTISLLAGRVALALLFLLVVTPLGLLLRALGKDLLRLKRPKQASTYWQESRPSTPLERLF